ncbi:hypothetical protein SprV_0200716400 [Sparganum proliferum]
MENTRLPKQLSYGDVNTGTCRQGGQKRCYKDTMKKSLKRLQINAETWENLTQKRPVWGRKVKTAAATYEANRITAAKAKGEGRESQMSRHLNTSRQPLSTCPRCQRAFRARVGLVGHLRTQCANNPTTSTSSPALTPAANPGPTVTPVTADHTVAAPPSPTADTIRPIPTLASTTVAAPPPPPQHKTLLPPMG